MSIYYQDDYVTLYHGDCLTEHREWLEADVLVTDPPYGMAYESRTGESIANDDAVHSRNAVLTAWGTRPSLVFGTWKVERPASTRQVLIWDKSEGNGTGAMIWSPWGMSHEEVYVLGEWPPIEPGGRRREGGGELQLAAPVFLEFQIITRNQTTGRTIRHLSQSNSWKS